MFLSCWNLIEGIKILTATESLIFCLNNVIKSGFELVMRYVAILMVSYASPNFAIII